MYQQTRTKSKEILMFRFSLIYNPENDTFRFSKTERIVFGIIELSLQTAWATLRVSCNVAHTLFVLI